MVPLLKVPVGVLIQMVMVGPITMTVIQVIIHNGMILMEMDMEIIKMVVNPIIVLMNMVIRGLMFSVA